MAALHHNSLASDSELLQIYLKTKSLKPLGTLYTRYLPYVYGVALKYLKNHHDAEEVSLALFELLPKKIGEQDIRSFKAWIYRVTCNHCLDLLRKKKVNNKHFEELVRVQSKKNTVYTIDEEHSAMEWRKEELKICIEKLESLQQQSIRLFYYDKKSYHEISEVLSISWAKTRSLIQNGRRNLKKCMES